MISNRDDITTVLAGIKEDLGIDSAYSHFSSEPRYPVLTYIGNGQSQLLADGTAYWKADTYQVELNFLKKDPSLEAAIEDAFLAGGWNYSKSEDTYLDDEGVYVIFYQLS